MAAQVQAVGVMAEEEVAAGVGARTAAEAVRAAAAPVLAVVQALAVRVEAGRTIRLHPDGHSTAWRTAHRQLPAEIAPPLLLYIWRRLSLADIRGAFFRSRYAHGECKSFSKGRPS